MKWEREEIMQQLTQCTDAGTLKRSIHMLRKVWIWICSSWGKIGRWYQFRHVDVSPFPSDPSAGTDSLERESSMSHYLLSFPPENCSPSYKVKGLSYITLAATNVLKWDHFIKIKSFFVVHWKWHATFKDKCLTNRFSPFSSALSWTLLFSSILLILLLLSWKKWSVVHQSSLLFRAYNLLSAYLAMNNYARY